MFTIIHDQQKHIFRCQIADQTAYLHYRYVDKLHIDVYTTFVPEALRSQGIADQLAQALWQWSQDKQLMIIPSCQYIAVWLKRRQRQ